MERSLFAGLIGVILMFSNITALKAHDVKVCNCDKSCYTEGVSQLTCSASEVRLFSNGVPSLASPTMVGITETTQQFPMAQGYVFSLPRVPKAAPKPSALGSGPIGVAVNGVPIFGLAPQDRHYRKPGNETTIESQRVLDDCGGHVGAQDDYHYHVAPICLIEELGEKWVEVEKKPIGHALDGFPIHALGWFDEANEIESQLDACRGYQAENGNYFYNVRKGSGFEILNCFKGELRGVLNHQRQLRLDRSGEVIGGTPILFLVEEFSRSSHAGEICDVLTGSMLGGQPILWNDEKVLPFKFPKQGSLFYCNSLCYGLFFNSERHNALHYEYVTTGCPNGFDAEKRKMNLFFSIKQ